MFDVTFWTVLIAATLTAVATGLGALPFLFVRRLSLFGFRSRMRPLAASCSRPHTVLSPKASR
jgi:hypothetical protein